MALAPWVRPFAYCENDRYAQSVLLSRMAKGQLPAAPIWDDVRSFTVLECAGMPVEIIYGGFPCQDISVAGTRKGLIGERSSLFFEIIRLTKEIKPRFVFIENVYRGIERHIPQIERSFLEIGYRLKHRPLSAFEVGANHRRDRWFGLAYSDCHDLWEQPWGGKGTCREKEKEHFRADWWAREPRVSRVAHGLPARMDRLRGLGNAVVPLQAREAFKRLIGIQGSAA